MTDTTCETCLKSSVCKFIDDFRQTEEQAQNLTRNSRLTPIEVHVSCKEHSPFRPNIGIRAAALDGIGG